MHDGDLLYSDIFRNHGLLGCFTKRTGGISPKPFDSLNFGPQLGDSDTNISIHLKRLMQLTGLTNSPHQALQVHGTDIMHCHGQGGMHTGSADALITCNTDTPLAVRTADCLPVLLADPAAGIIAAVHAGWRGTSRNIISATIAAMHRKGAAAARIIASLGPGIGPCCFHINMDTARALENCTPGAAQYVHRQEQISADLAAINHLQLRTCGLNETHIEVMDTCTACNPEQYFSFRRDQGKTGRQLAVVARPANP